jgi:hypothetical protein
MSFFGSSRRVDEHGVADLLEVVSQRTMSCTEEERKELGDLVKRVQRKTKPGPVEIIQRKLTEMNSIASGGGGAFHSPVVANKPKIPSLKDIGIPMNSWGVDLFRSFSKIQVLSSAEQEDQDRQGHTKPSEPGLLRDFGTQPTIAILPPLEREDPFATDATDSNNSKKDERQQDDSSPSSSETTGNDTNSELEENTALETLDGDKQTLLQEDRGENRE